MEDKRKVDKIVVLSVIIKFLILILLIFLVTVLINQNKLEQKTLYDISQVKNLSDGTEFRMIVRIDAFVDKSSELYYVNPPFVIYNDKWIYQVDDNTGSMKVNFSEAHVVGSEIELVANKNKEFADATYIINR